MAALAQHGVVNGLASAIRSSCLKRVACGSRFGFTSTGAASAWHDHRARASELPVQARRVARPARIEQDSAGTSHAHLSRGWRAKSSAGKGKEEMLAPASTSHLTARSERLRSPRYGVIRPLTGIAIPYCSTSHMLGIPATLTGSRASVHTVSRMRRISRKEMAASAEKQKLKQKQVPINKPKTHVWLIYTICGICVAVKLAWDYADAAADQEKDPGPLFFMVHNFMSNFDNLAQGRFHTLFTPAVSHISLGHIAANLVTFVSMGKLALAHLGPWQFMLLLAVSSVGCNVASLAYRCYLNPSIDGSKADLSKRNPTWATNSLGLSGCVFGIMGMLATVMPRTQLLFLFAIPCRISTLIAVGAATECTLIVLPSKYRPEWAFWDSAGHMGGLLSGYLVYRYMRFTPGLLAASAKVKR